MKDLFHQDVVEMIERETRKYDLWMIDDPSDPDFQEAYRILWDAFGPAHEMERREAIEQFLLADPFLPEPSGSFMRYFLVIARGPGGTIRGVRDGTILVNPAYSPDLCVVYLSHIYMMPDARGTVLSYWLRIAPVELAMQYLVDLSSMGKLSLPLPNAPGKYFGMRLNLVAEMEYFAPEERLSWQRILFYGRGGFDVINPRHFPYRQPDFRDPEVIRATGNQPKPFMMLVRRMGRERQATLPIDEAAATMRLLYDDFADHCAPEFLENSLQLVLDRLEDRAKRKSFVELLPLPTGPKDLHRLKRLFRYSVYLRSYPDAAETRAYLQSGIRETLSQNPRYLDDAIASIAAELATRPPYVYGSRDKEQSWNDLPIPPDVEPLDGGDGVGDNSQEERLSRP